MKELTLFDKKMDKLLSESVKKSFIVEESNKTPELYLVKRTGYVYKLEILDNIRDDLYNVGLTFKTGTKKTSTFNFKKEKDGKESNKFDGRFYTSKESALKEANRIIDRDIESIKKAAEYDIKRIESRRKQFSSL